jgi:hypothetical protein
VGFGVARSRCAAGFLIADVQYRDRVEVLAIRWPACRAARDALALRANEQRCVRCPGGQSPDGGAAFGGSW